MDQWSVTEWGMYTYSAAAASVQFERTLLLPLDIAHARALEFLVRTLQDPVAIISPFRRFRETNLPPDGGRATATPVVAAVGSTGISWAQAAPAGTPNFGLDLFSGFDVVTFNVAEVMLEGGTAGDMTFTNSYDIRTSDGEYMRALRFVLACAEFGFGGQAKTSQVVAPTMQNLRDARAHLGIA